MIESLVTQCPFCQTRFRLTPEQLNVAAGKVRCGACLEVFQASESKTPVSRPTPPPDTHPTPPDNSNFTALDELDEPDLEALGLDSSIIAELNPTGRGPIPDATIASPTSVPAKHHFDDLHADFIATPPARDFGPDVAQQRTELRIDAPLTRRHSDQGTARRDPAQDIGQNRERRRQHPQTTEQDALPDADNFRDGAPPPEPGPGTLAAVDLLGDVLFEEPVPRRPRRKGLWASLSVLALLALPAQFLFYNFDALARDQRSRPLLEQLCLLAQCELPARVDISRLSSANLLVRQDPEFPNALAIDVILYNRADFTQPFPVLKMQFTDAGGRTVASRRFRPEEYLSGELAGVYLMPSQTPIHIGLSMLDPGPQASGYSLEFVSP